MSESDEPRVVRNDAEGRYELWLGDTRAGFAAFEPEGDAIAFTHTVVDDAFSGQGLGSALARGALDDTVARGETIVPYCPFIAAYLRRHEEYAEHVRAPQG